MTDTDFDVLLIGGGIMSATLGTLLHELEPHWSIRILERLPEVASESSDAWNNAGTGHAALCELNYTSEAADGTIDIAKAIAINEQFQVSRQLWDSLVQAGTLGEPRSFINPVPHMTFVHGTKDVDFLRRRHAALVAHPLFASMEFSDDPAVIAEWAPLIMEGRDPREPVAATRDVTGTDVDFGSITRQLIRHLVSRAADLQTDREVRSLEHRPDGTWRVGYRATTDSAALRYDTARFVFVGAGGWALKLLQQANLPEAKGYALLPISGQFLSTQDPAVTDRHDAKVYGKAAIGAPPMSVPHLDTRVIDGKRSVLFGPYAGSSPKFLKHGSLLDLPGSLRAANLRPLLSMAKDNVPLVKLLFTELAASKRKKFAALQEFAPAADPEAWTMIQAGQRAQIVKADPVKGGVLQFGTEVITASDGSLAAVLGASPGASTAVPIMLGLLDRSFADRRDAWAPRLRELIPTFGRTFAADPQLAAETMTATARGLGLEPPTAAVDSGASPASV